MRGEIWAILTEEKEICVEITTPVSIEMIEKNESDETGRHSLKKTREIINYRI